jgi:hypothetical protein
MHAQFIVLPPEVRVSDFFLHVTGQPMVPGVSWSKWSEIASTEIEQFRPYIRSSHQRLINAALTLPGKICPFLRQLLRPFDLRIETSHGQWRLCKTDEKKGVTVKEGTTIDWSV